MELTAPDASAVSAGNGERDRSGIHWATNHQSLQRLFPDRKSPLESAGFTVRSLLNLHDFNGDAQSVLMGEPTIHWRIVPRNVIGGDSRDLVATNHTWFT